VKKAYEWCLTTVDPADGLMDNTKAGLAAVEVGPLRGKVTKDIYLEGFWLAALWGMQNLSNGMGDYAFSAAPFDLASKAGTSLQSKWWNPEGQFFAFGLTADGQRADMLGSWPALLLALFRLQPTLGLLTASEATSAFARPELATDWGIRWLSNKDILYDPMSYNNGSAWPFMSGFAAWAQYNYGYSLAGYSTWSSIARLTGLISPGALPELMNGDRFHPLERAVPHQLFSSVGVILPEVRGMLGLETVLISGEPAVVFRPKLRHDWPFIRFKGYPVRDGRISGEIQSFSGRMLITLDYDGKEPVKVISSPVLPPGFRVRRVLVDGKSVLMSGGPQERAKTGFASITLSRHAEIVVEYDGGIGIVPPEPRPEPGDRTTSLKIIRVEHDLEKRHREINLTLAGLGGRTYTLDLVTTEPKLTAEGTMVKKTENGYRLEISFEGLENEYVTRQIRLRW
jgi:hypothetical protein